MQNKKEDKLYASSLSKLALVFFVFECTFKFFTGCTDDCSGSLTSAIKCALYLFYIAKFGDIG